MTFGKRLFDVVFATVLLVIVAPAMSVIALLILVHDGRPVIYRSSRMKSPTEVFTLLKFRTMTEGGDDGTVSAAHKHARITPLGSALRHRRLDELPQLINVLRGDMSFVGPRPPLPRYVDTRPDLYAEVLKNRPGMTGLATLIFHKREEHILAKCHTTDETHATYLRRCVPIKARLDIIWARNRTNCYDFVLICQTVRRVFSPYRRTKQDQADHN